MMRYINRLFTYLLIYLFTLLSRTAYGLRGVLWLVGNVTFIYDFLVLITNRLVLCPRNLGAVIR